MRRRAERKEGGPVLVAFKAMHEHADSFGALPYVDGGVNRICRCGSLDPVTGSKDPSPMGCSADLRPCSSR